MCIKYQFNSYSKKEYFYKIFFPPFTIFVIMTSIMTYLQGFNGIFNTLKVFLGTFLFGWFMIFGFPLIYLYSNYFINGRKTKLKIDNDIIEYSDNNGKVIKFFKQHILRYLHKEFVVLLRQTLLLLSLFLIMLTVLILLLPCSTLFW